MANEEVKTASGYGGAAEKADSSEALAEKVFCALIASSYRTDNPREVAKAARTFAKAFVESA